MRLFRINERVWWVEGELSGWGRVALVHGDRALPEYICDGDSVITVAKEDSGEGEFSPDMLYQLAHGRRFFGEEVVWEHDDDIDYPLYCPARDENCHYVETSCDYELYKVENGTVTPLAYYWTDDAGKSVRTYFEGCHIPVREFIAGFREKGLDFVTAREAGADQKEERSTGYDFIPWAEIFGKGYQFRQYGDVEEDTLGYFIHTIE